MRINLHTAKEVSLVAAQSREAGWEPAALLNHDASLALVAGGLLTP